MHPPGDDVYSRNLPSYVPEPTDEDSHWRTFDAVIRM